MAGPARAGDVYWGSGLTQGGGGIWDAATAHWGVSAAGPFSAGWINGNNDTAIFGGTAGTVTLGGNVQVGGLRFSTGGYTIGGAYALGFGATSAITNNAGSVTFAGGVAVTNFSGTVYIGYNGTGNSLSIENGGQWYGGNVYVGYAAGGSAVSNRYNVGGPGAASTVSNGAIFVGGPYSGDGGAAQNYNTMTVSNATLQMGGTLTIGAGGNTFVGNRALVDKQGAIQLGTNSIVISISGYSYRNPSNNALVVTNGGHVSAGSLTVNGGGYVHIGNGGTLVTSNALILPQNTYLGTGTATATVTGGGSGGPTSTWNLAGSALTLNGNSQAGKVARLTVDGNGVNGGAVVTNVGTLDIANLTSVSSGAAVVLTNGARMFVARLHLSTVGSSFAAFNNSLAMAGGSGVQSILDAGGSNVNVGVSLDGGNNKASLATLYIGSGGMLTNAGALKVGYRPSAGYGDAYGNALVVTNGGQLFTTQDSYIGYNGGGGDGLKVVNNSATIGGKESGTGAGSLWNLGGRSLSVGYGGGMPTNNALTVTSGGVVTNIGTLAVRAGNALTLGAGGVVHAAVATNAAAMAVAIDNTVTPACGCLAVTGNLNISGATLSLIVGRFSVGIHIIAKYGTLTGPFAGVSGLPARAKLQYDYGGNQIAVIIPARGTVLIAR